MNISEANAVNVVARTLSGLPNWEGRTPTVDEAQSAIDLLLRNAHKALSAGLRPGEARVLPSMGGDA